MADGLNPDLHPGGVPLESHHGAGRPTRRSQTMRRIGRVIAGTRVACLSGHDPSATRPCSSAAVDTETASPVRRGLVRDPRALDHARCCG